MHGCKTHTGKKRKCRFYSTREKNSERKTGILQCYSISRLCRTEMGAASQLSAFSVLSVSFLFISGCIFLLQIPTFSLLNATVEDWNATKIPLAPNQKEEMGLDFAAGCSGLPKEKTDTRLNAICWGYKHMLLMLQSTSVSQTHTNTDTNTHTHDALKVREIKTLNTPSSSRCQLELITVHSCQKTIYSLSWFCFFWGKKLNFLKAGATYIAIRPLQSISEVIWPILQC